MPGQKVKKNIAIMKLVKKVAHIHAPLVVKLLIILNPIFCDNGNGVHVKQHGKYYQNEPPNARVNHGGCHRPMTALVPPTQHQGKQQYQPRPLGIVSARGEHGR